MDAKKLADVLHENHLSNREREVVELVRQGLRNKEVAEKLFVTEKTVKFHLTNIYKKLGVKSRAMLIVWCMPYADFTELPKPAPREEVKAEPKRDPSGDLPMGAI